MRTPSARRHLPAAIALAVLVAGAALLPTGTPQASAGGGVIPDLAMSPLNSYRVEWVNGRKLLRFTAMMVNVGSGHFEVHGHRQNTSQPMQVDQIIRESTARGSTVTQRIPTGAEGKWSGDGHNHWHVQEMMRYDLWGGAGTFRGAKVGFCFLDSDVYNSSLPGYSGGYYRGSWCGFSQSVLNNKMGISIGMGDEYEWYLAWQWVDITRLPNGDYTVRAKVDPYGFFLEENETNNCWYTRIRVNGNSVTALAADDVCVDDWSASPFRGNIQWAFDQGITFGCAPDLFCTNNAVTRAEMASFLVRALDLPPATEDHFADDEGSIHESAINRIAEAGITGGCGTDRFCPSARVTRAEMASFLARAYDLPPATEDHFVDDETSMHESNINRLAEAGIAAGCATDRFCPSSSVTRGQMTAFLFRAEN